MLVASILWYYLIMEALKWLREWIIAGRLVKAAEHRYMAKYALPKLFKKHPWMLEYLRACKRAEELGWPYTPRITLPMRREETETLQPPQTTPIPTVEPATPTETYSEQDDQLAEPELAPVSQEEQVMETPVQEEPRAQESVEEGGVEEGEGEDAEYERSLMRMLESFVDGLSVEEVHDLFRIIAESKGYGRLNVRLVARQIGMKKSTLHRYMTRGLPTSPSRLEDVRNNIKRNLTMDLKYNVDGLLEILRVFIDIHPERRDEVSEIVGKLMETDEEWERYEDAQND